VLVLYKNGFAAGLVAAILIPVIIALQPVAKRDPGASPASNKTPRRWGRP